MGVVEILIIGVISSIDGLFVGFAYGARGVILNSKRLFFLAFWTVPFCLVAMLSASLVGELLSTKTQHILSGLLLITAGILTLLETIRGKEQEGGISFREITLIGVGLALDGSVAAFSVGLLGANPIAVPIIFGIINALILLAGNRIGSFKMITHPKVQFLPSIVLMGLGVFELFV